MNPRCGAEFIGAEGGVKGIEFLFYRSMDSWLSQLWASGKERFNQHTHDNPIRFPL